MDHLVFILTGFGTVVCVLALLWASLAGIGRVFVARAAADAAKAAASPIPAPSAAPAPTPAPTAAPPAVSGVPPGHLAAIAAAVAIMTDGRGRVVQVRAAPHHSTGWARHGRTEQFAGHRVRWGWTAPAPTKTR